MYSISIFSSRDVNCTIGDKLRPYCRQSLPSGKDTVSFVTASTIFEGLKEGGFWAFQPTLYFLNPFHFVVRIECCPDHAYVPALASAEGTTTSRNVAGHV